MTATEYFTIMVAMGEATFTQLNEFFRLLADDTLENQEAMTLTPNDDCSEYTTVTGAKIKTKE